MRLVEPFAGLGSYSVRALWMSAGSRRDVRAEPPVSRVGSKAGFAANVFRAFGLQRAKWDAVLLNDLDPVCHLFHLLYASSELRTTVARRVWAMVPCPVCLPGDVDAALEGRLKPTPEMCSRCAPINPGCLECNGTGAQDARRLWERIRKEPVPGDVIEACAVGMALQAAAFSNCAVTTWDGQHPWGMQRVDSISTVTFDDRRDGCKPAALASRLEALPCGFATLADITAKALFLQSRSFQLKPVSIVGGAWDEKGMKPEVDTVFRKRDGDVANEDSPRWTVAERVEALPGRWVEEGYNDEQFSAERQGGNAAYNGARWTVGDRLAMFPGPDNCQIGVSRMDALAFVRGLELGQDDFLVLDPPYEGTTGYQAKSCRADVLEMARIGDRAGALVILHEAVGLARELGSGWLERSASVLRARGSTFHAGGIEREWVTMNRAPAWWPSVQVGLF